MDFQWGEPVVLHGGYYESPLATSGGTAYCLAWGACYLGNGKFLTGSDVEGLHPSGIPETFYAWVISLGDDLSPTITTTDLSVSMNAIGIAGPGSSSIATGPGVVAVNSTLVLAASGSGDWYRFQVNSDDSVTFVGVDAGFNGSNLRSVPGIAGGPTKFFIFGHRNPSIGNYRVQSIVLDSSGNVVARSGRDIVTSAVAPPGHDVNRYGALVSTGDGTGYVFWGDVVSGTPTFYFCSVSIAADAGISFGPTVTVPSFTPPSDLVADSLDPAWAAAGLVGDTVVALIERGWVQSARTGYPTTNAIGHYYSLVRIQSDGSYDVATTEISTRATRINLLDSSDRPYHYFDGGASLGGVALDRFITPSAAGFLSSFLVVPDPVLDDLARYGNRWALLPFEVGAAAPPSSTSVKQGPGRIDVARNELDQIWVDSAGMALAPEGQGIIAYAEFYDPASGSSRVNTVQFVLLPFAVLKLTGESRSRGLRFTRH